MRLCLIVALICIPLNISNIEHLYMYLLASYIACLEKSPFRFVHFVVRLFRSFFGWVLDWMSSLYILDISSLSDIHFAIIFSYSVCSLFIFKWFSLLWRNIFAILKWILCSLKFRKATWSLKILEKKENELKLCYNKWILKIKITCVCGCVFMLLMLLKNIFTPSSLMLGIKLLITDCIGQCVPGRRCFVSQR